MGRRNRFANIAGVARLELTDGDWIELKQELSVGDRQLQHFLMFTIDPVHVGQTVGIRPRAETALVAELAVALVGWSFEDEDGPVALAATPEAKAEQLRALTVETINEMRAAYSAHYDSAAAEEKKAATETTIAPS